MSFSWCTSLLCWHICSEKDSSASLVCLITQSGHSLLTSYPACAASGDYIMVSTLPAVWRHPLLGWQTAFIKEECHIEETTALGFFPKMPHAQIVQTQLYILSPVLGYAPATITRWYPLWSPLLGTPQAVRNNTQMYSIPLLCSPFFCTHKL